VQEHQPGYPSTELCTSCCPLPQINFKVTAKQQGGLEDTNNRWPGLLEGLSWCWPYLLYYSAYGIAVAFFVLGALQGKFSTQQVLLSGASVLWGALICIGLWPPVGSLLFQWASGPQGWKIMWKLLPGAGGQGDASERQSLLDQQQRQPAYRPTFGQQHQQHQHQHQQRQPAPLGSSLLAGSETASSASFSTASNDDAFLLSPHYPDSAAPADAVAWQHHRHHHQRQQQRRTSQQQQQQQQQQQMVHVPLHTGEKQISTKASAASVSNSNSSPGSYNGGKTPRTPFSVLGLPTGLAGEAQSSINMVPSFERRQPPRNHLAFQIITVLMVACLAGAAAIDYMMSTGQLSWKIPGANDDPAA
jgi:hypothetical protein